eukprot:GHVT01005797.1.p1 GENE.GHVT01005797.1~~GHVT01005797.1.p1  ORF type:complete len:510 (+),score=99.55 GHVT01005797.1:3149-4678(+)
MGTSSSSSSCSSSSSRCCDSKVRLSASTSDVPSLSFVASACASGAAAPVPSCASASAGLRLRQSWGWARRARARPTASMTKYVPKLYRHGGEDIDALRRRLYGQLLKIPQHTNLMRVYEVREQKETFAIVMEKMQGGELFDFLVSPACQLMSESLAKHLTRQLLLGLCHMHVHGVIHRDVKPENIMFRFRDARGKRLDKFEIALIDFDSCKPMDDQSNSEERPAPRRLVGTPAYMAPEVLTGAEPTEASDLWSVGLLLYIILTGVPPLRMHQMTTPQNAFLTLKAYRHSGFDMSLPPFQELPLARDLCRSLLEFSPLQRTQTAAAALKHPWLDDGCLEAYQATYLARPALVAERVPCRAHIVEEALAESPSHLMHEHVRGGKRNHHVCAREPRTAPETDVALGERAACTIATTTMATTTIATSASLLHTHSINNSHTHAADNAECIIGQRTQSPVMEYNCSVVEQQCLTQEKLLLPPAPKHTQNLKEKRLNVKPRATTAKAGSRQCPIG